MARTRKVFAVHPGEVLKTEFMEPMGVSAYQLAKALSFPGIYEVVRGDRAISADTAIRLGKYFGLPAQFWLNLSIPLTCDLEKRTGVPQARRREGIGSSDREEGAAITRSQVRLAPFVGNLSG
jgi:antitoxin HigA-1